VVGLEFAEVPGSADWGRPPALFCSDMVVGVTALALDPGLALVQ